jgi:hypothetical protein
MNCDELGRIWKEVGVAPGTGLEGLGKTTANLSQGGRCPDWDSNRTPPKYKSGAVPLNQPVRFDYYYVTSY